MLDPNSMLSQVLNPFPNYDGRFFRSKCTFAMDTAKGFNFKNPNITVIKISLSSFLKSVHFCLLFWTYKINYCKPWCEKTHSAMVKPFQNYPFQKSTTFQVGGVLLKNIKLQRCTPRNYKQFVHQTICTIVLYSKLDQLPMPTITAGCKVYNLCFLQ